MYNFIVSGSSESVKRFKGELEQEFPGVQFEETERKDGTKYRSTLGMEPWTEFLIAFTAHLTGHLAYSGIEHELRRIANKHNVAVNDTKQSRKTKKTRAVKTKLT